MINCISWFVLKKEDDRELYNGFRSSEDFALSLQNVFGNYIGRTFCDILLVLPLLWGYFSYISFGDKDLSVMVFGIRYERIILMVITLFFVLILPFVFPAMTIREISKEYDIKSTRVHFQAGLHFGVSFILYFGSFIFAFSTVLAKLFKDETGSFDGFIRELIIFIIMFAISSFYSRCLYNLSNKGVVIVGQLFSVISFVVSFLIMSKGEAFSQEVFITSLKIYVTVWFLYNFIMIAKYYNLPSGFRDIFVNLIVPFLTAAFLSAVSFGLNYLLAPHLGVLFTFIALLVLNFLLYWLILLYIRDFSEHELKYIYGGKTLRFIGHLFKIF